MHGNTLRRIIFNVKMEFQCLERHIFTLQIEMHFGISQSYWKKSANQLISMIEEKPKNLYYE